MDKVQKKPVQIVETVLRDAHQSLFATRMTTDEMLPIIDKMDKIGYRSVECWGGATFDSCLRFLHEDPWERLRLLKKGFKNTKLQMLFRGQNILGYNHYADDVVEYFVQKSVANGIDIIRIFDCLNDLRNLETAVNACKKEGAEAQIALSYTLGDAYTLEYWADIAKRIENMGADSICIKDMAGLLTPYDAYDLVKTLKALPSSPKIYLCKPIPAFKDSWTISEKVITEEIDPIIEKVVKKENLAGVIDLHTAFEGQTDLIQEDGIHPNSSGARKLAETVAKVIDPDVKIEQRPFWMMR